MKAYIAAPFFRPHQLQVVTNLHVLVSELGFEVFNPYEASRAIWAGRPPAECGPDERQAVLNQNRKAIKEAHVVVAWLRGTGGPFTDQGVVWELGYATGILCRPLTLGYLAEDEAADDVNLMIAESLDAACQGLHDLAAALVAFRGDGAHTVRRLFPVSKLVQGERVAS